MWAMRSLTVVIPLLLFGIAEADDHGVVFLYPPAGLTLHYKDTVNVSYTSPFGAPNLYTFCTESGTNALITELVQTTIPRFNGSSLVVINYPKAQSCYFDLRPDSAAGGGANSPSITIIPTARAVPTTASLSSPTSSSTSTTSPTPTSHANPRSKRSRIAIIVAISITSLVLLLAIAGFGFLWWKKRKSGYKAAHNPLQAQYIDQVDQKWHPGGGGAAGEYVYVRPMQSYGDFREEGRNGGNRAVELGVHGQPVELGGYPTAEQRAWERVEMGSGSPGGCGSEDTVPVLPPRVQEDPSQRPTRDGTKRFSWQ